MGRSGCHCRDLGRLGGGTPTYAQTPNLVAPCAPAPQEIRLLVERTFAETKDAEQTLNVAKQAMHLSEYGVSIFQSDDVNVHALSAQAAYYAMLSEALRKRDPITDILNPPGEVMIDVSVSTINGPNIEKVIVERGGQVVAATFSGLKPEAKTTLMGTTAVLNEGIIAFPCSAFTAGTPVVVTVIPSSGRNITKTLDNYDLRVLTLGRGRPPQ